jgi:hypothetical protein
LALLLPLCEKSQQLLLTQWGIRRDHQQTTLNVGLGQRWFNQAQGYWGYHLFYDYRRQGYHGRLGLGLEQRSATRTVTVNGYLPLSGWRIAEDQATQSRPARGIDLRLQQQLPQRPQLQLNAVLEHYFAQKLATTQEQPPLRPTAFTLGLEYTPLPLVTASYGYQFATGGVREHQLQLNLIYRLGTPLSLQLDPKQVAQSQTLASNRYALIRRNSQIVLEQRAYEPPAKADQADNEPAPQDTLQIAFPNGLQVEGNPGQSLTVQLKLTSSCALTAWNFTGEGDFSTQGKGAIQVDHEKQQAILTLPTEEPGDYSLQIVASKEQGVTTRSNTLKVTVRAQEQEQQGQPKATSRGRPPKDPTRNENSDTAFSTTGGSEAIVIAYTQGQDVQHGTLLNSPSISNIAPKGGNDNDKGAEESTVTYQNLGDDQGPFESGVVPQGPNQKAGQSPEKHQNTLENNCMPSKTSDDNPLEVNLSVTSDAPSPINIENLTGTDGNNVHEPPHPIPDTKPFGNESASPSDKSKHTKRSVKLSSLKSQEDFQSNLFNNARQPISAALAKKLAEAVITTKGPLETQQEFSSIIGDVDRAAKIIKASGLLFRDEF